MAHALRAVLKPALPGSLAIQPCWQLTHPLATSCLPPPRLPQEPPTLRGPGPSYSLYEAALPRILQSLRWAAPTFLARPDCCGELRAVVAPCTAACCSCTQSGVASPVSRCCHSSPSCSPPNMRRMPRFLTHIADEHGPHSQQLVRTLLAHGRLRCGAVDQHSMA